MFRVNKLSVWGEQTVCSPHKKRVTNDFHFISCAIELQIVSLAPSCHKHSKYVFGFEIRPWEVGQKIRRTSVTDRLTDKPLNLLYRCLITDWVGGVQKSQILDYVIYGWSLDATH